jgi:putative FmdB family regulatory protein
MPIFEFRCLKCNECFELLVMSGDDQKEVALECPKCNSAEFEKIMSCTNYAMGDGPGGGRPAASSETRTCSSGSCTTYNLPGPS